MIWFIVSIVTVVAIWTYCITDGVDFEGAVFGAIFGLLAIVIGGWLGNLIGYSFANGSYDEVEKHTLLALNDTSVSSGSFFLGSGTSGEEPAFFYYQQGDRGATLEHVDADKAVIVEENIDEPYLSVLEPGTDNMFWYVGGVGDLLYEFHIPEGSIDNSFRLDAE